MAMLNEITGYLDEILELERFPEDPSNNGLQFEGTCDVKKAVFAVDASLALFDRAADMDADFIFVHHGISWGPGIRRFTGATAERLTALAANGISLYAAHLPLDANELLGHNALLAGIIGLNDLEPFGEYHGMKIGVRGMLGAPAKIRDLAKIYDKELASSGSFRVLGDPARTVSRIGIISGGGAWVDLFSEIEKTPIDLLVTGTAEHEVFHPACEAGTDILTLGHYRSETPGVIAVMNTVRERFQIETEFVDIPTGL